MPMRSLRTQLFLWILAPLVLAVALDAWVTYRGARETATRVQQRLLVGAARMIGEQVQYEDGILQVVIPPSALELFESLRGDRVFYRVTVEDRLLSGYYDLALPSEPVTAEKVVYFDTVMRDRPVQCAAFAQPVLNAPGSQTVLIEVAQTLNGRDELVRDIWTSTLRSQLLVIGLVFVLLWFGLRRGIEPVLRLRDKITSRRAGTTESLDQGQWPSELQPLVLALNDYAQRLDRQMSLHDQFIANASHQLRTPFTLLNTQIDYAIRHDDAGTRAATLLAIRQSVQYGIRLVNQLLAFATVEAHSNRAATPDCFDLVAVTRRSVEAHVGFAQRRFIDIGFESVATAVVLRGSSDLAFEMITNLLDNALRYTQQGGTVTAHVRVEATEAVLIVEDNGPGIPEIERQRVFERFYRLHSDVSDGCGLGLAIVREIAEGCSARVSLAAPASGIGLQVDVRFPLPVGLTVSPSSRSEPARVARPPDTSARDATEWGDYGVGEKPEAR
jgi:two-component system sensor histidine kinase TctE